MCQAAGPSVQNVRQAVPRQLENVSVKRLRRAPRRLDELVRTEVTLPHSRDITCLGGLTATGTGPLSVIAPPCVREDVNRVETARLAQRTAGIKTELTVGLSCGRGRHRSARLW